MGAPARWITGVWRRVPNIINVSIILTIIPPMAGGATTPLPHTTVTRNPLRCNNSPPVAVMML